MAEPASSAPSAGSKMQSMPLVMHESQGDEREHFNFCLTQFWHEVFLTFTSVMPCTIRLC